MPKWKIEYWESANGRNPISFFIEKQPVLVQAKIANTFELLEEYGIQLGQPHVKKITGTKLWELRILGAQNIRFFYVAQVKKQFFILHRFVKKTNKIPHKELHLALKKMTSL